MSLFVGHSHIRKLLLSYLSSVSTGKVWLFSGQAGLGKAKLALLMSYFFINNCHRQDLINIDNMLSNHKDDLDRHLLQIKQGCAQGIKYIHGDVSTGINIEQVRAIDQFLSTVPSTISGKRMVIIDGINHMNHAAQNALLKNLEDHLHNTYFILITHNACDVLPTVLSRCLLVSFNALITIEIKKILHILKINLSDNSIINDLILQAGNMRHALWLYDILQYNSSMRLAYNKAWYYVLNSQENLIDFEQLSVTSPVMEMHCFLFLWQLKRIISFIFSTEIDSIALCDQEKQLWYMSNDYNKEQWLNISYDICYLLSELNKNMSVESQLVLIFGHLSNSLSSKHKV